MFGDTDPQVSLVQLLLQAKPVGGEVVALLGLMLHLRYEHTIQLDHGGREGRRDLSSRHGTLLVLGLFNDVAGACLMVLYFNSKALQGSDDAGPLPGGSMKGVPEG